MQQSHRPLQFLKDDTSTITDWAWSVILSARKLVLEGKLQGRRSTFAIASNGGLRSVSPTHSPAALAWQPGDGWQLCPGLPAGARDLVELYLPICGLRPGEKYVTGHLGQSLDGCIATRSGDACFVTGNENILHLHRMRALCDAIIVGAGTVATDNPRLTTRLVSGDNPVRVILDPRRRLSPDHKVFRDAAAPTLLVCNRDLANAEAERHGQAEVIGVRCNDQGHLDLADLLQHLAQRGLFVSFVEGGGVTVSAFAAAGLLDRLQITVAPVVIGAGRPGLQLPPADSMRDCLRPPNRIFRMGEDVLYDCEKSTEKQTGNEPPPAGIARVL